MELVVEDEGEVDCNEDWDVDVDTTDDCEGEVDPSDDWDVDVDTTDDWEGEIDDCVGELDTVEDWEGDVDTTDDCEEEGDPGDDWVGDVDTTDDCEGEIDSDGSFEVDAEVMEEDDDWIAGCVDIWWVVPWSIVLAPCCTERKFRKC